VAVEREPEREKAAHVPAPASAVAKIMAASTSSRRRPGEGGVGTAGGVGADGFMCLV
jgi:hypothetical protein